MFVNSSPSDSVMSLITLHDHEVRAADTADPETVDEEDFEEGEREDTVSGRKRATKVPKTILACAFTG